MEESSESSESQAPTDQQGLYNSIATRLQRFFSSPEVEVTKPNVKSRSRIMKTRISSRSYLHNKSLRVTSKLNSDLLETAANAADDKSELSEGLIQIPAEYVPRGQLAGSILTRTGDYVDVSFDTGSDVSCIESPYLFKCIPDPKVKFDDTGVSFSGIGSGDTEVESFLYVPLVIRLEDINGEILAFEASQVWLVEKVLTDYKKLIKELRSHEEESEKDTRKDCKILLGADFLRPHGLNIVWSSKQTKGLDCLTYKVPGKKKTYYFPLEMGRIGKKPAM